MLSPDKPIRMGWTVDELADKGELGGYCVHSHQTKVEKYSYRDTSKGKNHNVVNKLTTEVKGSKKPLLWIAVFSTLSLVEDAREEWNTVIVSTL